MAEFDGYWWAATTGGITRSPYRGKTWRWTKKFKFTRIDDWQEFNGRLYVIRHVFGRWNEDEHDWEYFSEGLPPSPDSPHFTSLAVHRGRLFAGVYQFDHHTETFVKAGLHDVLVVDLIPHQDYLYAAVEDKGLYRARIPVVHPHIKSVVTWGAIKQKQ